MRQATVYDPTLSRARQRHGNHIDGPIAYCNAAISFQSHPVQSSFSPFLPSWPQEVDVAIAKSHALSRDSRSNWPTSTTPGGDPSRPTGPTPAPGQHFCHGGSWTNFHLTLNSVRSNRHRLAPPSSVRRIFWFILLVTGIHRLCASASCSRRHRTPRLCIVLCPSLNTLLERPKRSCKSTAWGKGGMTPDPSMHPTTVTDAEPAPPIARK